MRKSSLVAASPRYSILPSVRDTWGGGAASTLPSATPGGSTTRSDLKFRSNPGKPQIPSPPLPQLPVQAEGSLCKRSVGSSSGQNHSPASRRAPPDDLKPHIFCAAPIQLGNSPEMPAQPATAWFKADTGTGGYNIAPTQLPPSRESDLQQIHSGI